MTGTLLPPYKRALTWFLRRTSLVTWRQLDWNWFWVSCWAWSRGCGRKDTRYNISVEWFGCVDAYRNIKRRAFVPSRSCSSPRGPTQNPKLEDILRGSAADRDWSIHFHPSVHLSIYNLTNHAPLDPASFYPPLPPIRVFLSVISAAWCRPTGGDEFPKNKHIKVQTLVHLQAELLVWCPTPVLQSYPQPSDASPFRHTWIKWMVCYQAFAKLDVCWRGNRTFWFSCVGVGMHLKAADSSSGGLQLDTPGLKGLFCNKRAELHQQLLF